MNKKKAQAAAGVGSIIMLIVGVGVAVLALIFTSTLSAQIYQSSQDDIAAVGNNRVVNETFTPVTSISGFFDHSLIQETTELIIINSSTGHRVNLSNFTINNLTGQYTLRAGTVSVFNGSTLKVTYTWGLKEVRDHTEAAILNSFEASEKTGKYLPLIVLAIVITVILSLIVGMGFSTGGGGRDSAL